MSHRLMASDLTVIHNDKSRAGEAAVRGHDTGLQSCSRRNDLKSGSRFIGIINAAVSPHGI